MNGSRQLQRVDYETDGVDGGFYLADVGCSRGSRRLEDLPSAFCRGGIDAAYLLPQSLVLRVAQQGDCSAEMQ